MKKYNYTLHRLIFNPLVVLIVFGVIFSSLLNLLSDIILVVFNLDLRESLVLGVILGLFVFLITFKIVQSIHDYFSLKNSTLILSTLIKKPEDFVSNFRSPSYIEKVDLPKLFFLKEYFTPKNYEGNEDKYDKLYGEVSTNSYEVTQRIIKKNLSEEYHKGCMYEVLTKVDELFTEFLPDDIVKKYKNPILRLKVLLMDGIFTGRNFHLEESIQEILLDIWNDRKPVHPSEYFTTQSSNKTNSQYGYMYSSDRVDMEKFDTFEEYWNDYKQKHRQLFNYYSYIISLVDSDYRITDEDGYPELDKFVLYLERTYS